MNLNENIFISLYAKIISIDIRNKVAIITEISAGIGLATTKLFTKNDAKVALATSSKDKLNKLAAELQNSFAILIEFILIYNFMINSVLLI